jgi:hypothetical protein
MPWFSASAHLATEHVEEDRAHGAKRLERCDLPTDEQGAFGAVQRDQEFLGLFHARSPHRADGSVLGRSPDRSR